MREYEIAECKTYTAVLGEHITVQEYHERMAQLRQMYGMEERKVA